MNIVTQRLRDTEPFTDGLSKDAIVECLRDYYNMESDCFDKRWRVWLREQAKNQGHSWYNEMDTLGMLALAVVA